MYRSGLLKDQPNERWATERQMAHHDTTLTVPARQYKIVRCKTIYHDHINYKIPTGALGSRSSDPSPPAHSSGKWNTASL